MLQDIQPKIYENHYSEKTPKKDSFILYFTGEDQLLCKIENGNIVLPVYEECKEIKGKCTFLFSIDNMDFFLGDNECKDNIPGYEYMKVQSFRKLAPKFMVFATITAHQLYSWYRDNTFCGRCGEKTVHDTKERMLYCPHCHNIIYPKICPGVIVAVTCGDKLLMTKYNGRPNTNYALVAGFTEIGETLEETVKREVMEEVGLKVKNITFYKSQPWSYSSSLLCGFFAEVDGSTKITLEEEELKEAAFFDKKDIPSDDEGISLTREMMLKFKYNL